MHGLLYTSLKVEAAGARITALEYEGGYRSRKKLRNWSRFSEPDGVRVYIVLGVNMKNLGKRVGFWPC